MNRLKDKPFALVGVNLGGSEPEALKAVMTKARLTWRSFADTGDQGPGPIAAQWNLPATPTLYVIDHEGVIRHKWAGAPGEKTIDAAVDKLIEAAEKLGRKTRPTGEG